MPTTTTVERSYNAGPRTTGIGEWIAGETGPMGWIRFEATHVIVALSGTATSVTAVVERSSRDPALGPGAAAAPADTAGITGNLATGVPGNRYEEAGVGWWRVRLTASSGGTVVASMSGDAS